MSIRVPLGQYPATRWTVLGSATPGRRRGGMRARVKCRCFCGEEQAVFVEDITRGRSRGCSSVKCRANYEASRLSRRQLEEEVQPALEELTAEIRDAMRAAALEVIERRIRAGIEASNVATRGSGVST